MFQIIAFAALSAELKKAFAYPIRPGWAGSITLAWLPEMTYLEAARLLSTAENVSQRAVGLWAIARCLDVDEKEIYKGKSLGPQELCLEALWCDNGCGVAYGRLGFLISQSGNSILLHDGRSLKATLQLIVILVERWCQRMRR